MDPQSTVVMDGALWIADAAIAAITKSGDPAPEGFAGVVPLETGGTVFPGLIELHNHVAYNALPLWQVPQKYTNRDTWGNSAAYHQLVTAPMKTIGEATDLLPALVRYVECKALVGGVTTTQGIALFSAPGVRRYYRGIVRNVEETGDKLLPEAGSRIADVDASDPQAFLAEIVKKTSSDEFAFKRGKASFGMAETADGIKKVGILAALIRNRSLTPGSILFLDEPETNLHPRGISVLIDVLFQLGQAGVQVYLATHSYFVLKQLEILAKKHRTSVPFCSLVRRGEIEASFADMRDGMPDNPILDESTRLFEQGFEVDMARAGK